MCVECLTQLFIPLKTCETKNFNNSLLKKNFDKLKLARQDKKKPFQNDFTRFSQVIN